mmetsp:Transcript_75532/g.125949  ORF Transcript_75532/g.125949 Transcript_75532/m.125949 type:complete len:120 (+) Transcript_75532:97-456(+)|eukprot:CAMPEP_0119331652 /NCGR_PEP_ID=MMETSP1333-20130426/81027_1 /TAXON_ID=418940 /ORGANISM="Scyphosphaera apsteinii, Strain RCC1455" /LENGTH=119 /DNA_ID=CAMNT_0007341305 /DNA_START=97 /DNA_END=456 /DNA_ORIENTATION=+
MVECRTCSVALVSDDLGLGMCDHCAEIRWRQRMHERDTDSLPLTDALTDDTLLSCLTIVVAAGTRGAHLRAALLAGVCHMMRQLVRGQVIPMLKCHANQAITTAALRMERSLSLNLTMQ